MAIKLEDQENTESPTVEFPYGQIKDKLPGVQEGTPVNKSVYQDIHYFFAHLMAMAAITYNDVFDNAYDGFQFFDALLEVVRKKTHILKQFTKSTFSTSTFAYVDITDLEYTTPDDGVIRSYLITFNSKMIVSPIAGVGKRGASFQIWDDTNSVSIHDVESSRELTETSTSEHYVIGMNFFIENVQPNTTLKIRIQNEGTGSGAVNVDTNNNVFIIREAYDAT